MRVTSHKLRKLKEKLPEIKTPDIYEIVAELMQWEKAFDEVFKISDEIERIVKYEINDSFNFYFEEIPKELNDHAEINKLLNKYDEINDYYLDIAERMKKDKAIKKFVLIKKELVNKETEILGYNPHGGGKTLGYYALSGFLHKGAMEKLEQNKDRQEIVDRYQAFIDKYKQ